MDLLLNAEAVGMSAGLSDKETQNLAIDMTADSKDQSKPEEDGAKMPKKKRKKGLSTQVMSYSYNQAKSHINLPKQ